MPFYPVEHYTTRLILAVVICLLSTALSSSLLLAQPAQPSGRGADAPAAPGITKPFISDNDVLTILRIKDTIIAGNTMLKQGMTVRGKDYVTFKNRFALMSLFHKTKGRFMVYRERAEKDEATGIYSGILKNFTIPAMRRANTPSETAGAFLPAPPMPPFWHIEVFRDIFWGQYAPRKLVVFDSLLMTVNASTHPLNRDDAFFFMRILHEGRRYQLRFRNTNGGFIISRQELLKTLDSSIASVEIPPCEIVYHRGDGTEDVVGGCTFVFPNEEEIAKEMAIITSMMKGQKPEAIRKELYEFFYTTYGNIDARSFKELLARRAQL